MESLINPSELLPHTFEAFLSRFGRLTEIQELSLEPLLCGENCVLTAATASGKTEAALAPILERFQKQRFKFPQNYQNSSTLKFLYVVPTKALARNIAHRIEQPLAKLAIKFAVKTGDETFPNYTPDFLITTPESLDSMLANRPKMLRDVQAVILDELHLYDKTPRGDQLRILLNRLRRLRKYAFEKGDSVNSEIQFCALSATLHNPLNVAMQYFTNPILIETKGSRKIEAEIFEFEGVQILLDFFATFKERNFKKTLVFCQSRAECEDFVHGLRGCVPFGDKVFVHHANLSANVRHQTEELFTNTDVALCFATSTLELGIDIGDIDVVLLIGSPNNLGSFLQRIGRGNRRTNQTNVACFYRNLTEEAVFKVFIRAAENSDANTINLLRSDNNLRFYPSVVVQQLCSYLKQTTHRRIDPEHAYGLFQTPSGEPLIDKKDYDKIIEYLINKRFFQVVGHFGNQLQAAETWEKLDEERRIYGNMSGTSESAIVVDNLTGRTLGFLDAKLPIGKTFLLDGKARKVTAIQGRKVLIDGGTKAEKFYQPRQKMVWRVKSAALTKELAREFGFPVADENDKLKVVNVQNEELGETRRLLFHNAGEVFGKAIAELLETEKKVPVIEHNEFFVETIEEIEAETLKFTELEINRMLYRSWKKFETAYDFGCFHTELPTDIRRNSVISAFGILEFIEILRLCNN
jgi:ATP-dependent helicase Lhr and Lhr-like helicase